MLFNHDMGPITIIYVKSREIYIDIKDLCCCTGADSGGNIDWVKLGSSVQSDLECGAQFRVGVQLFGAVILFHCQYASLNY